MPATVQQLQAQLDTLNAAIAVGATRVSYSTGSVEYRSLAEMMQVRDSLLGQLGLKVRQRRSVASFTGGFW